MLVKHRLCGKAPAESVGDVAVLDCGQADHMNPRNLISFTVALIALATIASVISDTIQTGWVSGYGIAVGFSLLSLILLGGWWVTDTPDEL